MNARVVAVVDCETTGVGVRDVPLLISLVVAEEDPAGEWHALARWQGEQEATVPIAPEAHAIHGLSEESLRGKHFDIPQLRRLLSEVQAVVSLTPAFDAKMLAKVLPEVLQMDWRQLPEWYANEIRETQGRLHGPQVAARLFDYLRQRQGKTARSKMRMAVVLAGGRIPVHPHLEGDLPLTVLSKAVFGKLFSQNLASCSIGSRFTLWTRENLDYIAGYMPGACGGQGLCFHLPKDENRDLAARFARGEQATACLVSVSGFTYSIEID